METSFNLGWIDYTIMVVYFAFVLGIGWTLKRYMKSSTDFLEAGRSIPAWITGLAFIATNLGALEVIGMAASGCITVDKKPAWVKESPNFSMRNGSSGARKLE